MRVEKEPSVSTRRHTRDIRLKKYVRVVKIGNKWNTCLQIGHQGFTVVEQTTKRRADWFAKMLTIALGRMIEQEANQ